MECNKDEAIRAKQIAEEKLLEKDFSLAKTFALKAQGLFPTLDGLSQFLEIIDVFVANEKKSNGEADYYAVLGVDPLADAEVIRKQYKRMALSLHPDKNKSVGADGAFKILSEAWSVLSDSNKRSEYNFKLNIVRASNQTAVSSSSSSYRYTTPAATNFQRFPTRPRTQWIPPSQQYTSGCSPTSHQNQPLHPSPRSEHVPYHPKTHVPAQQSYNQPNPSINPHPIPSYQQASARPPNVAQFIPVQRPPLYHQYAPFEYQPIFGRPPSRPAETFWTLCIRCNTYFEYKKIYLNQSLVCRSCQKPFLATQTRAPKANIPSSRPPHFLPHQQQNVFAGSGGSFQSSDECLENRETVNMKRGNDPLMKNRSSIPEEMKSAFASKAVADLTRENPVKRRRVNVAKGDETAGSRSGVKRASSKHESRGVRELSQAESRVMLMAKAKMGIRGLVNEWEAQNSKSSHVKVEKNDSVNSTKNNDCMNPVRTERAEMADSPPVEDKDEIDANPVEAVSMMVPDANFHNFDEDRVEVSFSKNQLWAAYDDDDGMPRYYALVHHVISRTPFKIQISWLNSKSCSEFGSLDWMGSGFTKTSGDFRAGKILISKTLNSFSHPVKWKKGPRGAIQILPTKGDVWAMYKNWSSDWVGGATNDDIVHKYDLVVVIEDYKEDMGVLVAPLIKVAGLTSVFNLDERGTRTISREEMFRFSHQVPFHILNGEEAENAPKGCYELDPAALPLELLKVITDAEAAEERVSRHSRRESTNGKILLLYSRKRKERNTETGVDQR